MRRAPRVCHGPLAVSLGAPPPNLPTPPPLNVGRRRLYRRSLDVELGEDDVGRRFLRGRRLALRHVDCRWDGRGDAKIPFPTVVNEKK